MYVNGDATKPIEYKYALNIEAYDEKAKKDYALEFAQANVGQNGLELVTHEIDDTLQVDSKFATEYRYRGGNVNNYVTFNNETWRIIGIIPTEDENGNMISKNHVNKLVLIYASDYGYAADSSCDALITLPAQNVTDTDTIIACKDNNWMYQTLRGYIITQPSNPQVWLVIENGVVRASISGPFDMYPVLTLSSNVKISGGSGTSSDPYQLQLN